MPRSENREEADGDEFILAFWIWAKVQEEGSLRRRRKSRFSKKDLKLFSLVEKKLLRSENLEESDGGEFILTFWIWAKVQATKSPKFSTKQESWSFRSE